MHQLLMTFDLGFPFVLASILVEQGEPSVAAILRSLVDYGLIDAA
jgi:hypothetical protein